MTASPLVAAPQKSLGIVIVTYNGSEVLCQALDALLPQCKELGMECRVVVVDNASTDGTLETVRARYPSVELVANGENVGPARAYNVGLRRVWGSSSYYLVLNNDVIFRPGTLGRMVEFLESRPDVSGATVELINPDGTRQYQKTAIMELWPRRPKRPARVTFVGTGCALIRAAAMEEVGLYDERFYFYCEDLDWSHRAKRKGHRLYYLPVQAVHVGGVGRQKNWTAIRVDLYQANVYYFWKNWGPTVSTLVYWAQRRNLRSKRRRLLRRLTSLGRTRDDRAAIMEEIAVIDKTAEAMDRTYQELRRSPRPSVV